MASISELFESAVQLQRAGRLQEAAAFYQQVVKANPRHANAWHQLGCIAFGIGQPDAAFTYLSRAILLDGVQAASHHDMGSCCRSLGRLADAQASYERALQFAPKSLRTRAHLCFTLYARGRTAEAEECARQTFSLKRVSADDHAVCGTLLLLQGCFAEGWAEHEWRPEVPPWDGRASQETKWDGSPLQGRVLLIHAEQGLGDTLQLVRYVPLVKQRGGQPILAVQRHLMPLLAEANLCELTPLEDPWPPYAAHLAMWSLPWALGTTLDSVPAEMPYLHAKPELVARWHERLSHLKGLRVGIHWQGNPRYLFDRLRSIPLAEFAPLAQTSGVRLISLQKNEGSEQLAGLGDRFGVVDLGAELDEADGAFMDTAAVMKNLDLVVTSDTATAHLAGALGVPVWMPLSTMPDWRWMLDRGDSPWYPTMRLFRQTPTGGWSAVFARMADALAARIAGRGDDLQSIP